MSVPLLRRTFPSTLYASRRLHPLLLDPVPLILTQYKPLFPKAFLSSGKDDRGGHENPGEHPRITLKDLGATRTVKIVVIAALMIAGTAESIFWVKVLWAKFGPAPPNGQGAEKGG